MFGSSWVLLGTPEAGLGVLAMMELRLPVIALTRNEAHTKALEATVDERLANLMLDETSAFTNPALTKLWIDAGGAKSSRKRKTRRKVNTPEKAHRMDGKQEKGRKASSVKSKEPEHSESEGEEDEEEECLEMDPPLPVAALKHLIRNRQTNSGSGQILPHAPLTWAELSEAMRAAGT